jgi:hypothetical protein
VGSGGGSQRVPKQSGSHVAVNLGSLGVTGSSRAAAMGCRWPLRRLIRTRPSAAPTSTEHGIPPPNARVTGSLFGAWADRIGSAKVVARGALGTLLITFPMYWLLQFASFPVLVGTMIVRGILPTMSWAAPRAHERPLHLPLPLLRALGGLHGSGCGERMHPVCYGDPRRGPPGTSGGTPTWCSRCCPRSRSSVIARGGGGRLSGAPSPRTAAGPNVESARCGSRAWRPPCRPRDRSAERS